MKIALLSLFISLGAFANPGTFVSHNLKINNQGFDPLRANGLKIDEYQRLVKKIRTVYTPIFKSLKLKFDLKSEWRDDTMNAFAQILPDGTRQIIISGGYARVRYMTPDAFLSIFCHEIGHHLGGAPRKNNNTLWASTEGEADYYSTLKCMKIVLYGDKNNEMESRALSLPPRVRMACQRQYRTEDQRQVCYRSIKAAEDYGRMLNGPVGPAVIDLNTPDRTRVTTTLESHPNAQCRTDTKAAGALCNADVSEHMDPNDEVQGSCHQRNGYRVGLRPTCWFKPR